MAYEPPKCTNYIAKGQENENFDYCFLNRMEKAKCNEGDMTTCIHKKDKRVQKTAKFMMRRISKEKLELESRANAMGNYLDRLIKKLA